MATNLSLEDLYHVAERVERRASEFHRHAADLCPDASGRTMLASLAEMEEEHERIFAAIRQSTPQPQGRPLTPKAAGQVRIVFEVLLGGLMQDLRTRFRGKTSSEDILREAIEFEKDTIVFFVQLGDTLDDPAERKQVQMILREELSHVFLLSERLGGERPRGGGLSAFVQAIA
jgi:rubrerythrin